MTLKLSLLFLLIDMLTLLAYPIVLVHGKLRSYSKNKNRPVPSQNEYGPVQRQTYDLNGVLI
jgi:hypothetical protein